MYTIGVLSIDDNVYSNYVKELEGNNYVIQPLDHLHFLNQLDTVDTVLIDYSQNEYKKNDQLYEIIMTIKKQTNLFIWILLKDSTKLDRLIFLQLGAGAVLDHTIQPDEFLIYLTNFFNNYSEKKEYLISPKIETPTPITLVPENISAILEGNITVYLTKIEYKLLNYLVQKKDQSATYTEIAHILWPTAEITFHHRTQIANIVFRLRQKIEQNPSKPCYIKTIRSVGYRIANRKTAQ